MVKRNLDTNFVMGDTTKIVSELLGEHNKFTFQHGWTLKIKISSCHISENYCSKHYTIFPCPHFCLIVLLVIYRNLHITLQQATINFCFTALWHTLPPSPITFLYVLHHFQVILLSSKTKCITSYQGQQKQTWPKGFENKPYCAVNGSVTFLLNFSVTSWGDISTI